MFRMSPMAARSLALPVIVLLASCASKDQARFADAATAPLNDLNVVQAKIPQVLQAAQKQPYLLPAGYTCEALALEIAALDDALGPDFDAPATEERPDLLERGTAEASKAAASALRNTTEGVIPFRGWVRKLTGAERHSRKVAAAISAGTARRAFLKGAKAATLDCAAKPAATSS